MKFEGILAGDTIRVTREFEVDAVNTFAEGLTISSGGHVTKIFLDASEIELVHRDIALPRKRGSIVRVHKDSDPDFEVGTWMLVTESYQGDGWISARGVFMSAEQFKKFLQTYHYRPEVL